MTYKVDRIGSGTFYGGILYPTIGEAREAQRRLGNDTFYIHKSQMFKKKTSRI